MAGWKTIFGFGKTVSEGDKTVYEGGRTASSQAVFSQGQRLLDTYRVESTAIESGGMGRVWRVHHGGWNVDLAMKRPREEYFVTEKDKEDFIRECQTWINLGLHPHIVSCYYVRKIEEIPTIFSEWMDGGSLADVIKSGKLYEGTEAEQSERILDIAIQFARGLHYAHEYRDESGNPRGLIHQDVKPGNLLLTGEWEAKVADFGLARARALLTVAEKSIDRPAETGADSTAEKNTGEPAKTGADRPAETGPGKTIYSPAGGYTPAYCSMEQMDGHALTRRTDIYSFAVSVMEMYVGSLPWANGVVAGLSCRDYFEKTRAPMPNDMKELLASCLRSDEGERPRDFALVEEELLRIYQKETGRPYPRPVSKAAADTADSLNNRALSFLDIGKQEEAERCWERALRNNPNHIDSIFNRNLYLWRSGKIDDTEVLEQMRSNAAVAEHSSGNELIAQLERESGKTESEKRESGKTGESWIRCEGPAMGVNLRNGVLVSTSRQLTSQNVKLTVRRWNVDDGALLNTFEYQESDRKQFFDKYEISPDGLYVLTVHHDRKARIRDLRTGECIGVMQARDARFVSDQIVLYIGKEEILWNFITNKKVKKEDKKPVIEEEKPVVGVKKKDGGLFVNQSKTNAKMFEIPVKEADEFLYLDLDSMRLWTADWRGTVKLWDIRSGRCLRTDYNEKTKVLMDETRQKMIMWKKPVFDDWFEWCLAELPEAGAPAQWQLSRIMSVTERLTLEDRVLALGRQFKEHMETGDVAAALRLHYEMRQIKGFENSELFRRQNRSMNGYCIKNSLHMMEHAWRYKLKGSRISAMKFSRDSDHLYIGSSAEDIKRIDPESGACTGEFQTELGGVKSLEIAGAAICAGTYGGHVERYDLRTGTRIDTPIPYDENELYPEIIEINRNGTSALLKRNGRIAVINTEDDSELSSYQKDRTSRAIFCPDGRNVLTYKNGNGQLEYLEKSVAFEKVTQNDISAVCISDDGRYAVSGGLEKIFLWDMKTGKLEARLKSDISYIGSVKFSADGRFLAVCGSRGSEKAGMFELWDVSGGKQIFAENLENISDVSFSPDGTLLVVSCSNAGMVQGHLESNSEIHAFRLSYSYEFPGFHDWDEGAQPYLEIFLSLYPDWTDDDFEDLITDLKNRGFGWLRPAGVRAMLSKMSNSREIVLT